MDGSPGCNRCKHSTRAGVRDQRKVLIQESAKLLNQFHAVSLFQIKLRSGFGSCHEYIFREALQHDSALKWKTCV